MFGFPKTQSAPATPPAAPPNEPAADIDPVAGVPKIQTNLVLTEGQIQAAVDRALLRIEELTGEMGLEEQGRVNPESWMGKRKQYQDEYDNEWEWRALIAGSIFQMSNFSLNIAKRYARLMSAKARDDLVGTDPFFAAIPEQHGDIETSKQVEWFIQEKIRQSNCKSKIGQAQKLALIRNECVVKCTYVNDVTKFKGPARVAIGAVMYTGPAGQVFTPAGHPIITPRGNYIYEHDDFVPDPNVEGRVRLQKEPNVVFDYALEFADFPSLEQRIVHQDGLDNRPVDWRDFLCPLNAATIHEADIVVHLFDEQHARLKVAYGAFEVSEDYLNRPYLSATRSANEAKGELDQAHSQVLRTVNCADVYMRCDVDDDGFEEEVWMIIDRTSKKAIWYDYMGAHMKKRPFEVVPGIEQVPDRWYGVGVFEMLAHKQLYLDTQFNRLNFRSAKNSSVRFRNKNAVAQWKADQEVVFGDDQVLDIEDPRFNASNPPLFAVQMQDVDPTGTELIQLVLQSAQTEVGISGADDAQMAGLETSKLAAGIKSLERQGNLLMKDTENGQGEAIAAILDQNVDIILEHMDEDELIFHPDSGALLELNREEIRALGKKIKLLLTRSRSTETIETARMVIQLVREYHEALTPEEQHLLRGEYIRQLKALEVPDAPDLLKEVDDAAVQAWYEQQAKAANLPPKTSIATKYPDLERDEQVQVLKREGITPALIAAGQLSGQDQKEIAKAGAIADVEAKAKAEHAPKPVRPAAPAASGGSSK